MTSTIQVGDLALITVGDQQFSFPIISIDFSGIHLSNYNIVSINNQWQVQGYHLPHTVSFYEAPSRLSFTGVPELDWNILLELDYQSLARACQASTEINRICQDDRFWKEKVRHEFGVDQYKPERISYQQQYRELVEAEDYVIAIINNRLDILIALEKKEIVFPDYDLMNAIDGAAQNGHLQVLEWLAVRNILPTPSGANWAAWGGHLQVLKWLASRNILPTQRGADWAAAYGHLQVLKWLAERNILPTQEGADLAAVNGHLQVLEWLATKNILPTREIADYVAMSGQLQVLEWLEARNILPTQRGADWAAMNGQLQVLEWLAVRNILPTQKGADLAAEDGRLQVLEWLAARGIHPSH